MPPKTMHIDFISPFELRSVLLFSALSLGAALTLQAQTHETRAPASAQGAPSAEVIDEAFNRADVNRDGQLSRQEAGRFPAIEQRFDQIDTNRDQAVSREEFHAALKF